MGRKLGYMGEREERNKMSAESEDKEGKKRMDREKGLYFIVSTIVPCCKLLVVCGSN